MKKFILGFAAGTLIIIIISGFWGFMPDFLGGRWDISKPNPITSNQFILWCDKLTNNPNGLGNVEATITKDGALVSDLTINLSIEKPQPATYPGAQPDEFMIPTKACFVGTNAKGVATFKKVPAGTAYIFFNNDPEAYPKRFGAPNYSITTVEVKDGSITPVAIDLSQKK